MISGGPIKEDRVGIDSGVYKGVCRGKVQYQGGQGEELIEGSNVEYLLRNEVLRF